jgi:hypothetical protein
MFNELKWRSIVMCFASLIGVDDASAGWFGPSTYNECVLDEMKGRPQYMMETVITDCTAKFCTFLQPTKTQIDAYNECVANNANRFIPEFCLGGGHYSCK